MPPGETFAFVRSRVGLAPFGQGNGLPLGHFVLVQAHLNPVKAECRGGRRLVCWEIAQNRTDRFVYII